MDDQRTNLPPSLSDGKVNTGSEEDDLLDMLWRMQGSRIEEQRCNMASAPHVMPSGGGGENESDVSSDELFDMIFRCQVSLSVCVSISTCVSLV